MSAASHPGRLASPAVLALSPYVPGKPIADLEREYGVADIIKLASNENPWGPSPRALEAMRQALDSVWLYPDGSAHELKQGLAAFLGVGSEQLTLGNGSNELLIMLAETFLTSAHSGVYSQYGFAIYQLVIRATGARCVEVPALDSAAPMPLGHDLAAMRRAIGEDSRLVFVANPNNPTGTWLEGPALRAFVAAVPPTTLVVLDEAYFEYARLDGVAGGLEWVAAHPNLVVLRTFSKAYGLAGVRVGYAVSHPEVAEALNRIRPAFNLSNVAQAGALAALSDQAHMSAGAARGVAERRAMHQALQALGLRTLPSAANFLLVEIGARAMHVYEQLLRGGVIVRPMGGYGLGTYLRITVGLPEHNARLLALLGSLLGQS